MPAKCRHFYLCPRPVTPTQYPRIFAPGLQNLLLRTRGQWPLFLKRRLEVVQCVRCAGNAIAQTFTTELLPGLQFMVRQRLGEVAGAIAEQQFGQTLVSECPVAAGQL